MIYRTDAPFAALLLIAIVYCWFALLLGLL